MPKDLQAVRVLEHLHVIAARSGNPVVVGAEGDIAVLIGDALVRLVRRRKMLRQRVQIEPLMLEQLGRNHPRLGLHAMLHPLGRPLTRLLVEILQAGERAAGKEVCFHSPEASFVPGFSITMPDLVAGELKAVLSRKRSHFGYDDRPFSRAAQSRQIGVVNDAPRGRIAPEHQRFVEKTLHQKTIEHAVEFQVAAFRVTQVKQAGNDRCPLPGKFQPIGRGVVLHLDSRLVGDPVATRRLTMTQSQLAQHPRQRRVADLDALLLDKLLVDPLYPAITLAVQTFQQFNVDLLLVASFLASELPLLLDNPPHGTAADMQSAADLPPRHPGLM